MNPKKTIKNIIKEELDDMQWIKDTEPLSISDKNWIIHNDVNNSEEEERRLQEWIYSQGYVWSNEFNIEDMLDGDCDYYINVNEVYFDAYRGWNDELDNMITHDGYELFNWSSIRKQLNINESEEEVDDFNDDFDWIRKININPWFDYNYILIDVTPTEENIESLINWALGSGLISERSLESWSEDLDDDISQIINYFYEYDKSYLRISDGGNLMYGYEVEPYGEWTKYSKIFQENINESEEEDDWAWTKGDPTLGELFDSGLIHEGDKIWVKGYTKVNVHSDKIYIDGWFIITNVGGSFPSVEFLTSNEICDILHCDNSGNFIDEDKNLSVYKIERESLTESEEEKDPFDWIRETEPISYDYLLGKGLEFNPPISDEDTLIPILNHLLNLGFDYGDWTSYIEWDEERIVGLYLEPRIGRIIYSTETGEDYVDHISGYADKPVEVLNGWDFFRGYLNESSDDDNPLKWIEDVSDGIILEPSTFYYFIPKLTIDEVRRVANNITNSDHIKKWLLRKVVPHLHEKGVDSGLKYFATRENVNTNVAGWCTSTPPENVNRLYSNPVDGRKEFVLY